MSSSEIVLVLVGETEDDDEPEGFERLEDLNDDPDGPDILRVLLDADAARAEMEAAYPGRRIAHPREVATAVVYLISDESSFVNGTPIRVNGAPSDEGVARRPGRLLRNAG